MLEQTKARGSTERCLRVNGTAFKVSENPLEVTDTWSRLLRKNKKREERVRRVLHLVQHKDKGRRQEVEKLLLRCRLDVQARANRAKRHIRTTVFWHGVG